MFNINTMYGFFRRLEDRGLSKVATSMVIKVANEKKRKSMMEQVDDYMLHPSAHGLYSGHMGRQSGYLEAAKRWSIPGMMSGALYGASSGNLKDPIAMARYTAQGGILGAGAGAIGHGFRRLQGSLTDDEYDPDTEELSSPSERAYLTGEDYSPTTSEHAERVMGAIRGGMIGGTLGTFYGKSPIHTAAGGGLGGLIGYQGAKRGQERDHRVGMMARDMREKKSSADLNLILMKFAGPLQDRLRALGKTNKPSIQASTKGGLAERLSERLPTTPSPTRPFKPSREDLLRLKDQLSKKAHAAPGGEMWSWLSR
jgi:hypothetical protein